MEWLFGGLVAAIVGVVSMIINTSEAQGQAAQQNQIYQQQLAQAQENLKLNETVANQNFNLSKEQFEYQKQLNELQMKREDTAMQRQVADLKAAGLSPLMASGGSSTGSYISASAPQKDMSGINSALANMFGVQQDYATRKQNAYMFQRQQSMQFAQMFNDLTSSTLDNRYKQAMIESQEIANAYNLKHGLRDPNLQTYLVDLLERYLDSRNIDIPSVVDDAIGSAKQGAKNAGQTMVDNAKRTGNVITDTLVNSAKAIGNTYQGAGKQVSNAFKNSKLYKAYQNYKNKREEKRKKKLEEKAQKTFNKAAANW